MPLIQDFVSRFESVRIRLSDLSWERGLSNFFLENVPFSFSTGKYWAGKMADLYHLITMDKPAPARYVYEWGAGVGMLSKHFLDAIQAQSPVVYTQTQLYVSDIAQSLMQELSNLQVFQEHTSKVEFRVNDVMQPTFSAQAPASFMYMTYLLDSLPLRHIEVEDGDIYEIQVKTKVADEAFLIDTTVFPPRRLSSSEIQNLFNTGAPDTLRVLAAKIVPLLQEEFRRVPLVDVTNISAEEKADLQEFVRTLSPHQPCYRFNYSFGIKKALTSLAGQLSPAGALVVYEFGHGYENPLPSITYLMKNIGITCAFPVFQPYIDYVSSSIDLNYHLHSSEQERIYIFSKNLELLKKSRVIFASAQGVDEMALMKQIKDLPVASLQDIASLQTLLQQAMPMYPCASYFLLSFLARYTWEQGATETAVFFSQQALENYGELAIYGHWYLALQAKKQGALAQAEARLRQILRTAPHYFPAYEQLAFLCARRGDLAGYLQNTITYIKLTPANNIWEHLIAVALVDQQNNKNIEAQQIVAWMCQMAVNYPALIPASESTKAEQILQRSN